MSQHAEDAAKNAAHPPKPSSGGVPAWLGRVGRHFGGAHNDSEFMREASAAVMVGPRPMSRAMVLLCGVFVVVALVWAGLSEVDEVAVGEGKVIPSRQVQKVQNLEGGIVSEIQVREGQTVQQGDVIMRIDPTRFSSSLGEGKAKDDALRARIARLSAEAGGQPFVAPADLAQENAGLVSQEKSLFDNRQREQQANLAVLQQQAEQRRRELAEKRSREGQLRDSLALASRELELTRPLARQGVVSEVELLRQERQVNDLKGDLDATRLSIPRLEAAVREIQDKMGEQTARFRADAARELNLARGEQNAISAANVGLEDRVIRTLVRAPVSGVVKQLKVTTVGGVVQPGYDLAEIVPADDTLLVEARIRPADIAFLRPGQEAFVKLTAYDSSIYGGFPATLEHISADTLVPERPGERPEAYYLVRVRTRSNKLSGSDKEVAILPGMVAQVDIMTGRKTVLQYLMKPIIKTKQAALRER
mgnify:CR=1 FL=1